jgi:hypothetical protein
MFRRCQILANALCEASLDQVGGKLVGHGLSRRLPDLAFLGFRLRLPLALRLPALPALHGFAGTLASLGAGFLRLLATCLAVGTDALPVGGAQLSRLDSCLYLFPDDADRGRADAHHLGDLPVGLGRIGLDELRGQFPLVLGGEVSAMNIRGDDKVDETAVVVGQGASCILQGLYNRFSSGCEAGAVSIPPIDDLSPVGEDRKKLSALLDVGNQRLEFGAVLLHQWKEVGGGMKFEISSHCVGPLFEGRTQGACNGDRRGVFGGFLFSHHNFARPRRKLVRGRFLHPVALAALSSVIGLPDARAAAAAA